MVDFVVFIAMAIAIAICVDFRLKDWKRMACLIGVGCILFMCRADSIIIDLVMIELFVFVFYDYSDSCQLSELVFYSAFLFLIKNIAFLIHYDYLSLFLVVICIVAFVYVRKQYPIDRNNIYWNLLAFMTCFCLFIYYVFCLKLFGFLGVNRNIMLMVLLFFMICLSYYMFLKFTLLNEEKMTLDQAIHDINDSDQKYELIKRKNDELRKLKHDLKYDYLLMKKSIKDNDYKDVQKIVDEKLDYLEQEPETIVTNCPLFDSILNIKLENARNDRYNVITIVSIQDLSFLEPTHLSLLLDYSFDLAQESTSVLKEINLQIKQDQTCLEINYRIPKGICQTNKKVSLLKLICKKYNGHFLYKIHNEDVILSIFIPV